MKTRLLAAVICGWAATASAQTVTVSAGTVSPGATFGVEIAGNSVRNSWIGLYVAGATDWQYLAWAYLNGQQTAPAETIATANLLLSAPMTPGQYEVRLFTPQRWAAAPVLVAGVTAPGQGRIVFNGDSITSPAFMFGPANWTAQVAERLGYSVVVNLATGGKYASGVLDEAPAMWGQACVVMVGTNDMAGSVGADVDALTARTGYLSTMQRLIVALRPGCGKIVIVSPPLSLEPREVLRYPAWVASLRELCVVMGVVFIDLFQHMADLSAVSSAAVVQGWYRDVYHLSESGHAMIADFIVRSGKLTP